MASVSATEGLTSGQLLARLEEALECRGHLDEVVLLVLVLEAAELHCCGDVLREEARVQCVDDLQEAGEGQSQTYGRQPILVEPPLLASIGQELGDLLVLHRFGVEIVEVELPEPWQLNALDLAVLEADLGAVQ